MKKLPKELKSMVHHVIDVLGVCIEEQYGKGTYKKIESLREQIKLFRRKSSADVLKEMMRIRKKLNAVKSSDELYKIAHSFSVYLELINQCELAYRSHRIETTSRKEDLASRSSKQSTRTIFVVTAHPTEARSQDCVKVLNEIREIIVESFSYGKIVNYNYFKYNISLLLRTPLAKQSKPTVADEAEYIYSLILNEKVLSTMATLNHGRNDVFVRSWVGGDKDGHPGVDEKVMIQSLETSRSFILKVLESFSTKLRTSIEMVSNEGSKQQDGLSACDSLISKLKTIDTIRDGDAERILQCKQQLTLIENYLNEINFSDDFYFKQIKKVFYVYPGLCVPLELREDSEIVKEASENASSHFAISRMLRTLKSISSGGDPRWYCRALILSMVCSSNDVSNGIKLVDFIFEGYKLPVVALLETRQAILDGEKILVDVLSRDNILKTHKDIFDGRYEVMLGYSDSSKESGSLSSRVLISQALVKLNKVISKFKVKPVFFHGSGGSISRGGGSLKEQISWWPQSALVDFKATIQGEMVQRTFSSTQVLKRNLVKIYNELDGRNGPGSVPAPSEELIKFSESVATHYQNLVADTEFLNFVEIVTPYKYLDKLKIGSRPSKRSAELSLKSLRAIPWILCWTQTRVLLVVWWGLGSAWKEMPSSEKKKIARAFKKEPVFASYIKQAAFSLAKVDMGVFGFYVMSSDLEKSEKLKVLSMIEGEYKASCKAIKELTGQSKLLWSSPWLEESISLRSTAIYPLNVLQRVALDKEDDIILRETVTGIASGMLTTG